MVETNNYIKDFGMEYREFSGRPNDAIEGWSTTELKKHGC